MRILGKDHITYYFGNDTGEPYVVKPGEVFAVETRDCFEDTLQSTEDLDDPKKLEFVINNRNPVTGPVYVEGAEPGDSIRIDIKKISIADH